jgi:hypothetical protein
MLRLNCSSPQNVDLCPKLLKLFLIHFDFRLHLDSDLLPCDLVPAENNSAEGAFTQDVSLVNLIEVVDRPDSESPL